MLLYIIPWINQSLGNWKLTPFSSLITFSPSKVSKANFFHSRNHPDQVDFVRNCSLVKELDDSAQGTGFAFIVMADVFTKIPGAPFWSALFFMMLLSLGLGSQIGILEGVVSTLFDQPSLKHVRNRFVTDIIWIVLKPSAFF